MADLTRPKHPERICWGCDRYCPANDLDCREERVPHPTEKFGGGRDMPCDLADCPLREKAGPAELRPEKPADRRD